MFVFCRAASHSLTFSSLNQPSSRDYRNDPNIPDTCRVAAFKNRWNSFNLAKHSAVTGVTGVFKNISKTPV